MDTVLAKRAAEKLKILYGKILKIGDNINAITPPSILVTEKNYPKVNLGVLVSQYNTLPDFSWIDEKRYTIDDIIDLRISMINLRTTANINIPRLRNNKLYNNILESELSIKEVNIEAQIKKPNNINRGKLNLEYGIGVRLKNLTVSDTPKIPKYVYRILEDEIKASKAVIYLYNKRLSDYYISRLLSLGALGLSNQRKLVPSKWAITATQKMIIDSLKRDLIKYNEIHNVYVFEYKFFGNIFYIILKPGNLEVELIEALMPGSVYNKNGNYYIIGRDKESGGYYSSILSSYEFLKSLRKKADVTIIRIVTRDYYAPLGVWVVREGVKRAFRNFADKFSNISEALEYVNKRLSNYGLNIFKLLKYSNNLKQKTILDFTKFK